MAHLIYGAAKMQTFTPNIDPRGANDTNAGKHGHHDVIHDVAFDYYGRRMATCSSDHNVRVWDYNEQANKWDVKEFRPHYGPVWRVCWAPPEYGHVSLLWSSYISISSNWEQQCYPFVFAWSSPGNIT